MDEEKRNCSCTLLYPAQVDAWCLRQICVCSYRDFSSSPWLPTLHTSRRTTVMTRTVILKLLVFMLAASLSENKETCSSQHGKVQDGLGCFEETSSDYVDPERRSQTEPKSQSSGTEDVSALRLVLVGLSGVGKSASGNTILGREEFESGIGSSSMTLKSKSGTGDVDAVLVTVVDTPGLFHTEMSEEELRKEMEEAVSLCDPGPHAFLLVIQLGRFTVQDQTALKELQEIYSRSVKDFVVVLFTYGDELRKFTIKEFIDKDTNLQQLVSKCNGQYHVFNNNDMHNRNQVNVLLTMVKEMVLEKERRYFNLTKEREISKVFLPSQAPGEETLLLFMIFAALIWGLNYILLNIKWLLGVFSRCVEGEGSVRSTPKITMS